MKCKEESHVRCCGGPDVERNSRFVSVDEIDATTIDPTTESDIITTTEYFNEITTESDSIDSFSSEELTTTDSTIETTTNSFDDKESDTEMPLSRKAELDDEDSHIMKIYPSEMSGKPKPKLLNLSPDTYEIDVYDDQMHSNLHLIFPKNQLNDVFGNPKNKIEESVESTTITNNFASVNEENFTSPISTTTESLATTTDEPTTTELLITTEEKTLPITTTPIIATTEKVYETSVNKTKSRFQRYRRIQKTTKSFNSPIIAHDKSISVLHSTFNGSNQRKFTTRTPYTRGSTSTTILPSTTVTAAYRKKFFPKRFKSQPTRKSEVNAQLAVEHEARIESLHSVLSVIEHQMTRNSFADQQKQLRNKLFQVKSSINNIPLTLLKNTKTLVLDTKNDIDEKSPTPLNESITATTIPANVEEITVLDVSTFAPTVTSTTIRSNPVHEKKMRRSRPNVRLLMDVSSRRNFRLRKTTTTASSTTEAPEIVSSSENPISIRSRLRVTPRTKLTPTSTTSTPEHKSSVIIPREDIINRIDRRIINRPTKSLPRQFLRRSRLPTTRFTKPTRPASTTTTEATAEEESEITTIDS